MNPTYKYICMSVCSSILHLSSDLAWMDSRRRAGNEQTNLDGQRIMENQWKEKNTELGCPLLQLMSCNVNSVEIMMADLGRKMNLGRSYRNWSKGQCLMPPAWRCCVFWETYSELLCHSLKSGDFRWILETLGFIERTVGEQGKAFSGIIFKIIFWKKLCKVMFSEGLYRD